MAPVCAPIQLASASSAGGLRHGAPRRCPAGWPCARRASSELAMALAASVGVAVPPARLTPLSAAMAAATSARALSPGRQALPAACCATGMAHVVGACQFGGGVMVLSAPPLRAAWRMRCANSGWSLRRLEPTTSTRCSCDSDAMEVPSQCDGRGCGEVGVAQAVVDVLAAQAAHQSGGQVAVLRACCAGWPACRCCRRRGRP